MSARIKSTVMTKAEIVKEVSKITGIENATVSAIVKGFMTTVKPCNDFKNQVK